MVCAVSFHSLVEVATPVVWYNSAHAFLEHVSSASLLGSSVVPLAGVFCYLVLNFTLCPFPVSVSLATSNLN